MREKARDREDAIGVIHKLLGNARVHHRFIKCFFYDKSSIPFTELKKAIEKFLEQKFAFLPRENLCIFLFFLFDRKKLSFPKR